MTTDHEPDEAKLAGVLVLLFGQDSPYVPDAVAALSPARRANVLAIGKIALARLGARVSDPDAVPARLLECLVNAGSFVEDPVVAADGGGVLASARTPNPRDDRGVRYLKMLERMSEQQIRTHYLFYAALRRLCLGSRYNTDYDFDAKRYRLAAFIPIPAYNEAMRYGDYEKTMLGNLVADTLTGLGTENLLDGSNTGSENYLRKFFDSPVIRGEGMVLAPSMVGMTLFLWAFGLGGQLLHRFIDPMIDFTVPGVPDLEDGVAFVYTGPP